MGAWVNLSAESFWSPLNVVFLLNPDNVHDSLSTYERLMTISGGLADAKNAVTIAMKLLDRIKGYPQRIKTQILLSIGQRSEEAGEISRWVAAGLLVPSALRKLDQVCAVTIKGIDCTNSWTTFLFLLSSSNSAIFLLIFIIFWMLASQSTTVSWLQNHIHILPSISLIVTGTEIIHRNLKKSDPEWHSIEDMVTYLYEIVSDVNGLVELCPIDIPGVAELAGHKEGGEREIRELRALVARTAQRLSECRHFRLVFRVWRQPITLIMLHCLSCEADPSRNEPVLTTEPPQDDEIKLIATTIKSRLSHLAFILDMQIDSAIKRRKWMTKTKGGNLKLGVDGQTKLVFGIGRAGGV
jgi:hypothetical protein